MPLFPAPSKVLPVAWRDFKHTVLTKGFLIGLVAVPVLVLAAIGVAGVLMATHQEPPLEGRLAIVDDGSGLPGAAALRFESLAAEGPISGFQAMGSASGAGGAAPHDMDEAMQQALEMAARGGMAGPGAMPAGRGEVNVVVEPVAVPAEPVADLPETLRARVGSGELLAAAMMLSPDADPAAGSEATGAATADRPAPRPRLRLVVAPGVDGDHVSLIESVLRSAVVDVRIAASGLDGDLIRELNRRPAVDTARLLATGEIREENEAVREIRQVVVPIVFMMLLWGATFTSGNQLLMSTIEEKSNRVMEVLLSAVSPLELLTGKILGQGLVGLIIIAVYSSLGIVSLLVLKRLELVTGGQLAALGIYFVMGYFMVAAMMAAVGSAVSDLREANSLLTPVMIVLMVPLFLWMPISQAPNGIVATVCSFIPPAIPFVMILRVSAEETVPAWQVAGSIAWGFVCVALMIWAAAKIFRVGVLMTGKPPSPLELARWLREA